MKLTLVTGNEGKYQSFQNAVKEIEGLKLRRKELEYPENHDSNSTSEIAEEGARYCVEKLGEPVIVSDGGLFIEALNSFPGVNTGFVMETIGNEGVLKLMEGKEVRNAVFRVSVGYADCSGREKSFTAERAGMITREKRGEEGFGFDPIFQLRGHDKTLAEDPSIRDSNGPLPEALKKFQKWADREL